MGKRRVTITVLKEYVGYSAVTKIGNNFISTESDTFEDLKDKILDAII